MCKQHHMELCRLERHCTAGMNAAIYSGPSLCGALSPPLPVPLPVIMILVLVFIVFSSLSLIGPAFSFFLPYTDLLFF